MPDTRVLTNYTPRSTGIPRTTTVNGQPIQGGSSASSHISASPAAAPAAQRLVQQQRTGTSAAQVRAAQAMSGSSHPGAGRMAPGVQTMPNPPQVAGRTPPRVARIDLAAQRGPVFTMDECVLIGGAVDGVRNTELEKGDKANHELLALADSALVKLIQIAQDLATAEQAAPPARANGNAPASVPPPAPRSQPAPEMETP